MTYTIELSEQAQADLRGIFEYIALDLQSKDNALSQLRRLRKEIYSLDQFPERYRLWNAEPWHSRNLRIMPVDSYLVLYLTDVTNRAVQIMRVLYGGQDIAAQIDGLAQQAE